MKKTLISVHQMNKIRILAIQSYKHHYQFSRKFSSKEIPPLHLTTCIQLLQSSAQNKNLNLGKNVHSHIFSRGLLNSPISATSLINMYSKCSSISDALSVFYESTHVHNVFVYNSIIAGLTTNDFLHEAFELYSEMRVSGVAPDKFTFPCVIKSCRDCYGLRVLHKLLFNLGMESDSFIGSALIHSYLKFNLIDDAVKVFDELPDRDDIVLWNAMINGYVQIGELNKALLIFRRMAAVRVEPNDFTVTGLLSALALAGDIYNGKLIHSVAIKMGYSARIAVSNVLIDMYGKCRHLTDASMVFHDILEKDIYSWNSIISVHEQCGDHEGTLSLLKGMLHSGFYPDLVTVTSALPACSHLSALMRGREIHAYMVINDLSKSHHTYTQNAIMDMYAKCGSMREARLVFDSTEFKDVASWNIMVMGYGMHGHGHEALDLFHLMCEIGMKPDEISFVGVLSACSHMGFVDMGKKILEQIVSPTIEHYGCVIDMLGRANRLDEALELIGKMSVEPNHVVWRSFLGACRVHGNGPLAEVAAMRVIELEPEHCGSYVLMSNVYGAEGKFDEVADLRSTMREHDVKKLPGCSWIELGDGVHVFFTGSGEGGVYAGLDSLTACLSEGGWVLDVMESCV